MLAKNNSLYLMISAITLLLSGVAITIKLTYPTWQDELTASLSTLLFQKAPPLESNKPRKANSSAYTDKKQISDINNKIRSLESELATLRSQLTATQQNLAAEQSEDQQNLADIDQAKLERERTNQLVTFLDQQMRAEQVDTKWSENAKSKIMSTFSETGFINNVECFSTLCRVTAEHDNQDSERAFIMKLTGLETFINTDAFVERKEHEDGSISTQIFIARSNHRLPEPRSFDAINRAQ